MSGTGHCSRRTGMIRLSLISDRGRAAEVISAPHFRITGGSVWIGPSAGGEKPIVRFVAGRWKYTEVLWSGLRFEPHCRVVFGLAREPLGVSEDLGGICIDGYTLWAAGTPFAVFDRARDMWRAVGAQSWWHAFRVESVELARPAVASRTLQQLQALMPPSPTGGGRLPY